MTSLRAEDGGGREAQLRRSCTENDRCEGKNWKRVTREQKNRRAESTSLSSGAQFHTIPMNIFLSLRLGFSIASLSFTIVVFKLRRGGREQRGCKLLHTHTDPPPLEKQRKN